MRKLYAMMLVIVSIMAIVVSKSHGEDVRACVSKTGQVRAVNDHSECMENERPRTFDTSISHDAYTEEIDKTMPSSGKYVLNINKDGTGRGTVLLSPSGIGNDSAPVQKYNKGTLIVLTASPDENSVFAGWKGDGCLGTGVCVLTMSSDKTVTATFHETNVSETLILPKGEKSHPPVLNKEEATRYETEEAKKQTNGKALQFQKRSESIYTVQVGAFRNDSYARSLRMILIQRGYDAYMTNSKSKDKGEFHKVLIGKFGDKGEAEKLSRKIAKTEGLQTFVTLYGIGQ